MVAKKNKGGRPRIKIDYKLCEELAGIFCTQEEIAGILGVSASTLKHSKKFLHIYKRGQEGAKMSLRRKQFKLADTNAGMAIFLGKNYLGQRDSQEIDLGDNVQKYFDDIAGTLKQSYTKAD